MSSLLNKMTQGVQTLGKLVADNKLKEKLAGAVSIGPTLDELETFSSLWELPEPVEYCRGCENHFATRKHHCRSCAGVFCDDCAPSIVPASAFEQGLVPVSLGVPEGSAVRICHGCRRGECPSREIIDAIR